MTSSSIGKLYYTTTSCGSASYIAAVAAGVTFESEQVDLQKHVTDSGADFYGINPKGNVPTLVLPNGTVLNEGVAVLQYIADQNPASGLAPAFGTIERYLLINELNYIATEVHKSYGPLFNPANTGEARERAVKHLQTKLGYLEKHDLSKGNQYLLFNKFTIADAYLYIVLSWSGYAGVKLDEFPNVQKYFVGIGALDVVKKAHAAMNAAKKQ